MFTRRQKFIFGEEDIIDDNKNDEKSCDEGYNAKLLETNLMYTYDTTLGYLLSFSHGDFNFNIIIDNNNHSINNHSINNSLPLQDEDLFKLKEWLISHSLQNVYKKLA
eukprot:90624_1